MVRITEDVVRKRAEHNDGQISSLVELSLHQLDIERIEFLDRWCPRLEILYLQGNLISKIENVGRLKRLVYLNLATNNLTRIENLAGCESLSKLDLTLNFIRNLSDIDQLNANHDLRELYLTGNPCAAYDCYRQFSELFACLNEILDGTPIERSERIVALQNFGEIQRKITDQEEEGERIRKEAVDCSDQSPALEDNCDTFWTDKTEHTPEARLKLHRNLQRMKGDEEKRNEGEKTIGVERRLVAKDGRILNINEPRVDFRLMDGESVVLDIAVYRYLETSLVDVDVQPSYVQVFIKQKLLQLALNDEVRPDQSIVQRSQTTGHLIITMPKVKETLKPSVRTYSSLETEAKHSQCDDCSDSEVPELI